MVVHVGMAPWRGRVAEGRQSKRIAKPQAADMDWPSGVGWWVGGSKWGQLRLETTANLSDDIGQGNWAEVATVVASRAIVPCNKDMCVGNGG